MLDPASARSLGAGHPLFLPSVTRQTTRINTHQSSLRARNSEVFLPVLPAASHDVTLSYREGLSVDALRERAKKVEGLAAKERLARASLAASQSVAMDGVKAREVGKGKERKDSSPVKVCP